ncbi:MAG: hypothetical protein WBB32_05130 [Flavobacteriales bacterium]
MPEFPIEKKELVYPGEGSPFPTASPSESSSGGPHQPGVPAHPAVPPTELPRNKIHLSAVESKPLLDILSHCIAACERCITGCEQALEPHKYADCIATSRACVDICKLLQSYVTAAEKADLAMLAVDLAMVTARVCEACALQCSKHPNMEHCVACERACREAAKECRSFAK